MNKKKLSKEKTPTNFPLRGEGRNPLVILSGAPLLFAGFYEPAARKELRSKAPPPFVKMTQAKNKTLLRRFLL